VLRPSVFSIYTKTLSYFQWTVADSKSLPPGSQSREAGFEDADCTIRSKLHRPSVLFSAIFDEISLIWEKDLGIVQKFLVSPAPRSTRVLGRVISSTARACYQSNFNPN
jgi:hypothetical protein